jgi:hypothetical protein
MTSSSLLESAALLLLVTAAACGESATELAAKQERQRAATPNQRESDQAAIVVSPVFSIQQKLGTSSAVIEHMPPGFTPPPGQFYGFDVKATGFAPGSYSSQTLGRFLDGTVFVMGESLGGVVFADGAFRTGGAANCPSRFSEIWVVVNNAGRKWESPHFVPPC